jgi:peptidoglycan/LPS O-acetylase OafA/YrhL
MMLGFDLDDEEQTVQKKQTLFLVIGLVLFILAISVYLVIFSGHDMLSNWMTAMATYFVLYSLICKERKFNGAFLCGRVANIIRKFGENSYFIYLFHTIFAYVFVAEFRKIMLKVGIDTDNMMWFIILIPIIIALSYLFGKIFNMIVNWVMRELDRK